MQFLNMQNKKGSSVIVLKRKSTLHSFDRDGVIMWCRVRKLNIAETITEESLSTLQTYNKRTSFYCLNYRLFFPRFVGTSDRFGQERKKGI